MLKRIQLMKQLNGARKVKADTENLIRKLSAIKQINALRKELGFARSHGELENTDGKNRHERSTELTDFFKENLQGKLITAADGNKILFNRNQSEHLIYNGRIGAIAKEAVKRTIEVFETGKPTGRQELSHSRADNLIAFWGYVKYLIIENYRCLVEAKAGINKTEDEKAKRNEPFILEVPHNLIAYSNLVYEKTAISSPLGVEAHKSQAGGSANDDSSKAITDSVFTQAGYAFINNDYSCRYVGSKKNQSSGLQNNNTLITDNVQDDFSTLTILEITDLDGNPIRLDDEPVVQTQSGLNALKQNPEFFGYNGANGAKSTKGSRQKANNAAYEIVRQIQRGELSLDSITDEQRIILSHYSGNGAGMKNGTGKIGSQYEYYTPKEVAGGMWDLLKEMGFNGGKVLDPCAGTGIFSLAAPDNALIHSVELSDESGTVNQAIFHSDPQKSCEISPFERVAASTPDEGYDAIITNVPFGENKDRGGNEKNDPAYQDFDLDSYFILRSLDKLRPNGLAVFMSSTRIISGKSHEKIRRLIAMKAEFMGAYRLPNKLFAAAGADVVTDVMVFKKHSRENAEIIKDLNGNPVLEQANVLWTPFIQGVYFRENPRFVLGKETVGKGRYGEVMKVVNDDSIANISKLMKRFDGSRIDWEMLNATEAPIIEHKNGDVEYFNGRAFQFSENGWQELQSTGDVASSVIDKLNAYQTALGVFEQQQDIHALNEAMQQAVKMVVSQNSLSPLVAGLIFATKGKTVNPADLTLLIACIALAQIRNGREINNYLELYPTFSKTLKSLSLKVLKTPQWFDSQMTAQVKFLNAKGVYNKHTKAFSDWWQGIENKTQTDRTLSPSQQYEALLYREGVKVGLNGGVSLTAFKQIFPDVDLDTTTDWCISLDGTKVLSVDDYYFGNYGEFCAAHEKAISETKDSKLKSALIKQLNRAQSRLVRADVYKMDFDITSSYISLEDKVLFLNQRVANGLGEFIMGESASGEPKIEFKAKSTTAYDDDKVLSRLANYVTTRSFSLAAGKYGTDDMSEEQHKAYLFKRLNETLSTANQRFSTWVKSNKKLTGAIDSVINKTEYLEFKQTENDEPLNIAGINPAISPRPHQAAYVRQQARRMGGICGYDVGLGKTLTALLTAQHLQSIGIKRKTLFVVPNSTLTNWKKEARGAYTDDVFNRCLFVGLVTDKGGQDTYQSKNTNEHLILITKNQHDKVYMTFETFKAVLLQDDTIKAYLDHLATVDPQYMGSIDAKKDAKAASNIAELRKALKGTAAEYLEKMGFDSLIIDEAHAFKNAKKARLKGQQGVRYLSLSDTSAAGANALAKAWYLRGDRDDGILCLTATPITNSPLEIYSMLALTAGEARVAQLAGVNDVEQFLENVIDLDFREEQTAAGEVKDMQVFSGLKNVTQLRKLFSAIVTMKNADDIPNGRAYIPESEELAQAVSLTQEERDNAKQLRELYKRAAVFEQGKKNGQVNLSEKRFFSEWYERTGETSAKLAHPFNYIGKAADALIDRDLTDYVSKYTVASGGKNAKICKTVIEKFNKLKLKETRVSKAGIRDEKQVLSQTVDEQGNMEFTIKPEVYAEGGLLILTSKDFGTQSRLLELAEKEGLELGVSHISAKMAALLENVKFERSSPKAKGGIAKQIIFCDTLGAHNKLKLLLSERLGIAKSRIQIINAQSQPDPADLQDIQDGFNADADENKYEILIANEKAEVGINLQKGTQAIHHLTVGWTPDSLQQRNGRGVRQGNYLAEQGIAVKIYHYDAKGSFDEYKRKLVNHKADWITSLLNGEDKVTIHGTGNKQLQEMVANAETEEELKAVVEQAEKFAEQARIHSLTQKLNSSLDDFCYQQTELKNAETFEQYFNQQKKRAQIAALGLVKHFKMYQTEKRKADGEYKWIDGSPQLIPATGAAVEKFEKRKAKITELWVTFRNQFNDVFDGNLSVEPPFELIEQMYLRQDATDNARYFLSKSMFDVWDRLQADSEGAQQSALYQQWQEQVASLKSALAITTETAKATNAELGGNGLALDDDFFAGKALFADGRLFKAGDIIMRGDAFFLVEHADTEGAMIRDVKFYAVINPYTAWDSKRYSQHELADFMVLDKTDEKLTALFKELAEYDQGKATAKERWSSKIPQVLEYFDENAVRIELSSYSYQLDVPYLPLFAIRTLQRFKDDEPDVYTFLAKQYAEYGVSYDFDEMKIYAKSFAPLKIKSESFEYKLLAAFKAHHGFPITKADNIDLDLLLINEHFNRDADVFKAKADKVTAGMAFDPAQWLVDENLADREWADQLTDELWNGLRSPYSVIANAADTDSTNAFAQWVRAAKQAKTAKNSQKQPKTAKNSQ